jgi:hypothetical protein
VSDENDEMTEDEFEAAMESAILLADDMINTFVKGLRQFQFFNPETDRATRVRTLIAMINDMADADAMLVLAATAIVTMADQEKITVSQ